MLILLLLLFSMGSKGMHAPRSLKKHLIKILIKNKESQTCPYFTPFEMVISPKRFC